MNWLEVADNKLDVQSFPDLDNELLVFKEMFEFPTGFSDRFQYFTFSIHETTFLVFVSVLMIQASRKSVTGIIHLTKNSSFLAFKLHTRSEQLSSS